MDSRDRGYRCMYIAAGLLSYTLVRAVSGFERERLRADWFLWKGRKERTG